MAARADQVIYPALHDFTLVAAVVAVIVANEQVMDSMAGVVDMVLLLNMLIMYIQMK
jgi:hypothetical protein